MAKVIAVVTWLGLLCSCIPGRPAIVPPARVFDDCPQAHVAEALRVWDVAAPIILHRAIAAGYVTQAQAVDRLHSVRPVTVCAREQPRPCTAADRRARGCMRGGQIEVARYWPPVCDPRYPGELGYCAPSASHQSTDGWRSDLVHEISHWLAWHVARVQYGGHDHPWRAEVEVPAQRAALEVIRGE